MPRARRLLLSTWLVALPIGCALVVLGEAAITRLIIIKPGPGILLPDPAQPIHDGDKRIFTPQIAASQVDYTAAMQIQVAAIIGAVGAGLVLILMAIRSMPRPLRFRILLGVVIGAAALLALAILDSQSSGIVCKLLPEKSNAEFFVAFDKGETLDVFTGIAAAILAVAASLLIVVPKGSAMARLKQTVDNDRRLSYLLALGTVLLAAQVFSKTVLLQWVACYYSPEPKDLKKAMETLGERIVAGWGIYDSLFLAATYIPTALVLKMRTRHWEEKADLTTAPRWLSDTSFLEIARVAAILGPFVVGQAANLFHPG